MKVLLFDLLAHGKEAVRGTGGGAGEKGPLGKPDLGAHEVRNPEREVSLGRKEFLCP